MTCNTSEVAASCSSASSRSRFRRSNCSAEGSIDTGAVGALRTLGRPFTCCPLSPPRCMSPASGASRRCSILGKSSLPRHGRMSALGQKQTCALQLGMSALHPIATTKADMCQCPCLLCYRKRRATCAPKTPYCVPLFDGAGVIGFGDDEPEPSVLGGVAVRLAVVGGEEPLLAVLLLLKLARITKPISSSAATAATQPQTLPFS